MQLRTAIRTISIRESRGERIAKTDKTERERQNQSKRMIEVKQGRLSTKTAVALGPSY